MYSVQTDHQIIGAADLMVLIDSNTLSTIVTATRESGWWTITAIGLADVTVDNRSDAIDAMLNHALESQPGSGYSTMIPNGLRDLP